MNVQEEEHDHDGSAHLTPQALPPSLPSPGSIGCNPQGMTFGRTLLVLYCRTPGGIPRESRIKPEVPT
jgi:hypothetical protein